MEERLWRVDSNDGVVADLYSGDTKAHLGRPPGMGREQFQWWLQAGMFVSERSIPCLVLVPQWKPDPPGDTAGVED